MLARAQYLRGRCFKSCREILRQGEAGDLAGAGVEETLSKGCTAQVFRERFSEASQTSDREVSVSEEVISTVSEAADKGWEFAAESLPGASSQESSGSVENRTCSEGITIWCQEATK